MQKYLIPLAILIVVTGVLIFKISQRNATDLKNPFLSGNSATKSKGSTPTPTLTPTPTPRPLTFEEMQKLYGPCAVVPTLFYHHIQDEKAAKEKGQTNISIDTTYFEDQMQYLKEKNYNPIFMHDLVNFFDSGTKLPAKPILLTFDDGYEDFYLNVFPLLQELKFKATLFIPTGLMDNSGYLTWEEISKIGKSGLVLFANHTWSHHSVSVSKEADVWEISTADTQLTERGYNSPKVFAYPYGDENSYAKDILTKLNYPLAFSTKYGRTLCKGQRLGLPRMRIGNSSLEAYGL